MNPHRATSRMKDPRVVSGLRNLERLIRDCLMIVEGRPEWHEPNYLISDARILHYLVRGPGAARLRIDRKSSLTLTKIRRAYVRLEDRDWAQQNPETR